MYTVTLLIVHLAGLENEKKKKPVRKHCFIAVH